MTNQLLKERIPFLQAKADGKTIECSYPFSVWQECGVHMLLSGDETVQFRIKPEPSPLREWTIVLNPATKMPERLAPAGSTGTDGEYVRVREVQYTLEGTMIL